MMQLSEILVIVALAALGVQAKPSYPFELYGTPDHIDFAPPVLPPTHFHAAPDTFLPEPAVLPAPPAHFLPPPAAPAHFLPPPAQFLPAPAPLLPAPAPLLPAEVPIHTHWLPAPAPPPALPVAAPLPQVHAHFFPAPAPLLPAPVLPAPVAPEVHTHILPAPEIHVHPPALSIAQVAPPAIESVPIAPRYRVIPGPKTTTHHVSFGYAFPKLEAPHAHLHAAPLAHLHAAPLKLAHHLSHHSLF